MTARNGVSTGDAWASRRGGAGGSRGMAAQLRAATPSTSGGSGASGGAAPSGGSVLGRGRRLDLGIAMAAAIRIPDRVSTQLALVFPTQSPRLFVHEGARQALERR